MKNSHAVASLVLLSSLSLNLAAQAQYRFVMPVPSIISEGPVATLEDRQAAWAQYAADNGLTCPGGCGTSDFSDIIWYVTDSDDLTPLPNLTYPNSNPNELVIEKRVDMFNSPSQINSLDSLSSVETVGTGGFWIGGGVYTNIDGLSNLTSVQGTLSVRGGRSFDQSITDITGLSSLTYVGDMFQLDAADSVTTSAGAFTSLVEVAGDFRIPRSLEVFAGDTPLTTIGGDFEATGSSNLSDISGLSNVTSIGGTVTLRQYNVSDLSPMSSIASIGGDLHLYQNPINDLRPIENINLSGYISVDNRDYTFKMAADSPMCTRLKSNASLIKDSNVGGDPVPVSRICL